MRARGSLRALICKNWGVGAGVGYEDISGERLQNGSGGEASGPSPTPTDSPIWPSSSATSWNGEA